MKILIEDSDRAMAERIRSGEMYVDSPFSSGPTLAMEEGSIQSINFEIKDRAKAEVFLMELHRRMYDGSGSKESFINDTGIELTSINFYGFDFNLLKDELMRAIDNTLSMHGRSKQEGTE